MPEPRLVARENELQQLNGFLNKAIRGEHQICFLVGEAGSGKSTLVYNFAQQAQQQFPDLIAVTGNCNAYAGMSDPYLPFRQLLSLLTDGSGGKTQPGDSASPDKERIKDIMKVTGQALIELGPDLIGVFIPAAGLVAKMSQIMAEKSGWMKKLKKQANDPSPSVELDQNTIFYQYTAVLKQITERKPLLLIIDDLHWADSASISLLFHLTRELANNRIMIIGSYRPDEIALGRGDNRHPLETVVNESKRYQGDVIIDLSEAVGWDFINAYLDTEDNHLGDDFRKALYQRTNGHPLFTVEILREMQERGDLIKDESGNWIEADSLDWDRLPARIEGVVEERIGRLDQEICDILSIASVEGSIFTAQITAGIVDMPDRQLLRILSGDLEKRHKLVYEYETSRVGSQLVTRYSFSHIQFQHYLYHNLSDGERMLLHGDVAQRMEALYENSSDMITSDLAHHYFEAGDQEKASEFLYRAGRKAFQISAYEEARWFFGRALDITPESNPGQKAIYANQLGNCYERLGDYDRAVEFLDQGLKQARLGNNQAEEVSALSGLGLVTYRRGEYDTARGHLTDALQIARRIDDRHGTALSLNVLGMLEHDSGDYEAAETYYEESLEIFTDLKNRTRISGCLNNLGTIAIDQQDYVKAQSYFEQCLIIDRELGDQMGISATLSNLSIIAIELGEFEKAQDYLHESLTLFREIGHRLGISLSHLNLGYVYTSIGEYQQADICYRDALRESSAIEAFPVTLNALAGVAGVKVQANQNEEAARLLGLIQNHPAYSHDIRRLAEPPLHALQQQMTEKELEALLSEGAKLDLTRKVEEILLEEAEK